LGEFYEGFVVGDRQSLERRVAAAAARADRLKIRSVESREEWVRSAAEEERVQAAAVAGRARVGGPFLLRLRESINAFGLRGFYTGAADGAVEEAAGR
jgi:hypothetical protein